ncbi:MAG: hypothetical protein JNM25_04150 [Planctomycetes bacterium]|nr:hypothetical protein [Planctomycetota bacterium]
MDPDSPAAAFADRCRFLLAGLIGLGSAAPAMLLLTAAMFGWRDTRSAVRDWWPQIAVGYVAMLLVLFAVSGAGSRRVRAAPALLVPLHLLLFVVGAATGCLANCLWHAGNDWSSWFVKPLFWLLLLGSLPALCIGCGAALAYGWLERRGY